MVASRTTVHRVALEQDFEETKQDAEETSTRRGEDLNETLRRPQQDAEEIPTRRRGDPNNIPRRNAACEKTGRRNSLVDYLSADPTERFCPGLRSRSPWTRTDPENEPTPVETRLSAKSIAATHEPSRSVGSAVRSTSRRRIGTLTRCGRATTRRPSSGN